MQQQTLPRSEAVENILELAKASLAAEAKITYLGVQTRPILTVAYATVGSEWPVTLDHFMAFQRVRRPHSNDVQPGVRRFTLSPGMFQKTVASAGGTLAESASAEEKPILSFTVVLKIGDDFKGQEFLICRRLGERFYRSLIKPFEESGEAIPAPLAAQFRGVYP